MTSPRRMRRRRRPKPAHDRVIQLAPGPPEEIAAALAQRRAARSTLGRGITAIAVTAIVMVSALPRCHAIGIALWIAIAGGVGYASTRSLRGGWRRHRAASRQLAAARAHQGSLPPARIV